MLTNATVDYRMLHRWSAPSSQLPWICHNLSLAPVSLRLRCPDDAPNAFRRYVAKRLMQWIPPAYVLKFLVELFIMTPCEWYLPRISYYLPCKLYWVCREKSPFVFRSLLLLSKLCTPTEQYLHKYDCYKVDLRASFAYSKILRLIDELENGIIHYSNLCKICDLSTTEFITFWWICCRFCYVLQYTVKRGGRTWAKLTTDAYPA